MRVSKDQYYLNIAKEVAQRSTCYRVKIGAVILRDDQIIATGYVGAPRKTKDCLERGFCLRDKLGIPHGQRYELCRSVHAEQNCVSQDSLTILPDGEIKRLKSVYSNLLSLDTSNFKIQFSQGKRFEKNSQEVIRITTTGNHEIEVSPDHEMFVADKVKILSTKKARDLTLEDFLPFAAKIKVKGASQSLPKIFFTSYKLNREGRKIFQSYLDRITWKGLAKKCGFSMQVIARLRRGEGIKRKNKERILRFYPALSSFFEGLNFHQVKIPLKTNPDFCQIAGYFLGDGSVGKRYIAFYDESREMLECYQNLCNKTFHLKGSIIRRKGDWRLTLCSYRLSSLFSKLDFGKRDKRKVPSIFHRIPKNSLAKFLRGFADAEGTVGKRSIHLSSHSKRLLEELGLLFLRFGIIASLYKSSKTTGFERRKKRPQFSLEIAGSDLKTFYQKIGFSHPLKRKKLERVIKEREGKREDSKKIYFKEWFRGAFPSTYFPLLRDYQSQIISRETAKRILGRFMKFGYNQENLQMLRNLIENIVFLKIKKIKKLRKKTRMIDYYVPGFNSFLVNGFIVHNCIINSARAGVSLLGGDMYIYGEDSKGKKINAFPCFICKKMIINAGLNRIICSTREGGYKIFKVQDWIREWQEKDITDDQHQYGVDQNQK